MINEGANFFADRAVFPAGTPVSNQVPENGAMLTILGLIVRVALNGMRLRRRQVA